MSENFNEREISPNKTRPARYLCYVNGLQVPIVAAYVDYGVNALQGGIPTATIEFFPSYTLQRLGADDRVSVAIFYLDLDYNPDAPEYRLLFDGEICGWNYQTTGGNRSISAFAQADISILNMMSYSFMATTDALTGYITDPNNTAAIAQAGMFFAYTLFRKGMVEGARQAGTDAPAPNIQAPFELLYNIVRFPIDKNVDIKKKSIPSLNFFARWSRRRRFYNKFVATPFFDKQDPAGGDNTIFPLLRATQSSWAMKSIQQHIALAAGGGSMLDMLRQCLEPMYYELATLPTAPALHVDVGTGEIVDAPKDPDPKKPLRIANYFLKPKCVFAIPPQCNVVYPSMVRSMQYQEDYWSQPTRMYFRDSWADNVLSGNVLAQEAITTAYPPQAHEAMKQRLNLVTDASKTVRAVRNLLATGKNILVWPEEFFKGPVALSHDVPELFRWLVLDESARLLNTEDVGKVSDIMAIYAKYEYYRTRSVNRGGRADLVFNPYLVPGYPCVVFDRPGGLHQIGYLNQVQHTLTANTMSTSINYTDGRTVNEWLELIESAVKKEKLRFESAPIEPIEDVRKYLQDPTNAATYYSKLFGLGEGRAPAFKPVDELERYAPTSGTVRPLSLNAATEVDRNVALAELDRLLGLIDQASGEMFDLSVYLRNATADVADARAELLTARAAYRADVSNAANYAAFDAAVAKMDHVQDLYDTTKLQFEAAKVRYNTAKTDFEAVEARLTGDLADTTSVDLATSPTEYLRPTAATKDAFTSTDAALQRVARPVCTLDAYTTLLNGRGDYRDSRSNKIKESPDQHIKGAPVPANLYINIDAPNPGPGEPPDVAALGIRVTEGTVVAPAAVTELPVGDTATRWSDAAETIKDWTAILQAYRDDVYANFWPKE